MNNQEDEEIRRTFISGLEPSDELRQRFDAEVEDLLRHRLSKWARFGRIVLAVIFGSMSLVFVWAFHLFATAEDAGLTATARMIGCYGFAVGAIAFFIGALFCAGEARSGKIAPRLRQKAQVFIPYAVLLTYTVLILVHWRNLDLPVEAMIKMTFALIFFWVMAWGFVLSATAGWHREDILLEEKRTQLEIALLADQLRLRGQSASDE